MFRIINRNAGIYGIHKVFISKNVRLAFQLIFDFISTSQNET